MKGKKKSSHNAEGKLNLVTAIINLIVALLLLADQIKG